MHSCAYKIRYIDNAKYIQYMAELQGTSSVNIHEYE